MPNICYNCGKRIDASGLCFVVPIVDMFTDGKREMRLCCSEKCATEAVNYHITLGEERIRTLTGDIQRLLGERQYEEATVRMLKEYKPLRVSYHEAHERLERSKNEDEQEA